jgi:tRNA A-37 threonylcarbamoyl transferase component Bud32
LKISGIATPRAIAVIEKRIGPLRSTGYYVCDFVAGMHAEAFFQDDTVDAFVKEQVAGNFAHLFELFHQLKISHGDCKSTNFLLKGNEPWVLDLDAMQVCSSPVRFKKLFQVDRQRFLRNWQALPELQQWFDDHLPGRVETH